MRGHLKVFCVLMFFAAILFAQESVFIKKIVIKNSPKDLKPKLEKIVKPYENRSLTIKDIRKIAFKLNYFLKKRGDVFMTVVLPPQKLNNGILTFEVVRAKVGKIKVIGNRYFSKKFIKNNLDLNEGGYLSYPVLVNSLLFLNSYEDLMVKSYLSKGEKFGQTDITLKVEDTRPFHASMFFDNLGSSSTSRYRWGTSVNLGNAIVNGDSVNLFTMFGLKKFNTKLYQIGYVTAPFTPSFTRIKTDYLYANYIVSGSLSVLDLRGDTHSYDIAFLQPLKYSLKNRTDLSIGYRRVHTRSYILGKLSSQNKFNVLEFSLIWKHISLFNTSNVVFKISHGFDNHNNIGSRVYEKSNFLKYNINVLMNKYVNKTFSSLFKCNVQYSSERLPLSQMFTIGGLSSVRGFDTTTKSGDYGYVLSAELIFQPLIGKKQNFSWQTGLFIDNGGVYLHKPVPGEEKAVNMTGSGFEVIFSYKKRASMKVGIGFPLNCTSKKSQDNGPRIYALAQLKLW